ncbi:hypothetical protein CSUI_008263, partial [Cystoisospora suis]
EREREVKGKPRREKRRKGCKMMVIMRCFSTGRRLGRSDRIS